MESYSVYNSDCFYKQGKISQSLPSMIDFLMLQWLRAEIKPLKQKNEKTLSREFLVALSYVIGTVNDYKSKTNLVTNSPASVVIPKFLICMIYYVNAFIIPVIFSGSWLKAVEKGYKIR